MAARKGQKSVSAWANGVRAEGAAALRVMRARHDVRLTREEELAEIGRWLACHPVTVLPARYCAPVRS